MVSFNLFASNIDFRVIGRRRLNKTILFCVDEHPFVRSVIRHIALIQIEDGKFEIIEFLFASVLFFDAKLKGCLSAIVIVSERLEVEIHELPRNTIHSKGVPYFVFTCCPHIFNLVVIFIGCDPHIDWIVLILSNV